VPETDILITRSPIVEYRQHAFGHNWLKTLATNHILQLHFLRRATTDYPITDYQLLIPTKNGFPNLRIIESHSQQNEHVKKESYCYKGWFKRYHQ